MSKTADRMYATIIGIALAVIVVSAVVVVVRFVFGGAEDTWICSGGQWIMHGRPAAPKPTVPCTL